MVTADLVQLSDPEIGERARSILRSPSFLPVADSILDLFIRNYQAHDDVLIMSALERISPHEDQIHSFSFKWNPCMLCRRTVVKLMIERELISPRIVSECLYDANEAIQLLVKPLAQRE